jgi:hypothetical protein
LSELCAAIAAHAEAHSEDRSEVVVLNPARSRAIAFGSNYSITSNSCLALELALLVGLLEMVSHRAHADVKEPRHERLQEPDGPFLEPAFDARSSVLGSGKESSDVGASRSIMRVVDFDC